MVDAGGEGEDGGGKCGEALENGGDAFDEEGFGVGGVEVGFLEFEGVEAAVVGFAHFGGGEDDATEAAGGADVDLVGFGEEHAGVDDVPGAAGGGGVFEGLREGGGEGGARDGEGGRLGGGGLDAVEHGGWAFL